MKEAGAPHEIYLAHRLALIKYAAPILGSREAAEDIVQDAYLRFAPSGARFDKPEQTVAYLYRIVRNLAFDVLKRRKVEKRESDNDTLFWATPRTEQTPEQMLLFCNQVRIVSEVLGSLSMEARIAIEMHRFGGFTLQEVADHLGISVPTAHRYIRSAMMKIAEHLDPGDG